MSSCEEQCIADVRIGLGYTAVMLDNDSVGLAYTLPRGDIGRVHGVSRQASLGRQAGG